MARRSLVVAAVALLMTVSAFAAPVTIVFTSFQQPTQWQLGYPYIAAINGVPGIPVMCDDWEHGGLPGQTWQANYTNLGTFNLSLLRFNQSATALTFYKEAGWLILQTTVTPKGQAWTDINYAVWYIFDPSTPITPGGQYWLQLAQDQATLGFPGVDFSRVGIYTPVNQYDPNPEGPQELLTIVPEPTTLLLLAGGLAGVLGRRKLL